MIEQDEKFLSQIKAHEGFRNYLYFCPAGFPTIGYGHNLLVHPIKGIERDSIISTEEGTRILVDDVKRFGKDLNRRLPWWRELTPPRQAVLLNMAFNMGIESLMKFKTTLGYIARGKYAEASVSMLKSRWAEQVGGRAKQLSKQMATGEWQ